MKLKGQNVETPYIDYVVFPRQDEDIIFTIQAVLNYDEFDAICPRPKPPVIVSRKKGKIQDVEAAPFLDALNEWVTRKANWTYLKSLQATEELEWDSIDMADPDTWENIEDELTEACFTAAERLRLIQSINVVNGLDETKIEEARERFLATLEQTP